MLSTTTVIILAIICPLAAFAVSFWAISEILKIRIMHRILKSDLFDLKEQVALQATRRRVRVTPRPVANEATTDR